MAVGGVAGAAVRRAKAENWFTGGLLRAAFPQLRHDSLKTRPGGCPEIDCIRHLLPDRIVAAAERRARSIGVGAERVLICADAITEEAYLTALATSLATSYERFDGISRNDCPLADDRLIEAAAAGLLPLRQGRGLVWIVAPRGLTARRLADPRQERPRWLQSFRLTSEDRLRHFVARHTQRALGKRAAEGLRRSWPLLSNAPRAQSRRTLTTGALVMIAFTFFALAPVPVIEGLSGLCCVLFLAAAILRLLSACFTDTATPYPDYYIDDTKLPIYTVMGTDRLAIGIGPADTAECGFRLFVLHRENARQRKALGGMGKEEMLGHLHTYRLWKLSYSIGYGLSTGKYHI